MTITFVDDSATISTTEYFLVSDSTSQTPQTVDCILQCWIDFANMVAGDEYRVRFYEKVNGAGATQRLIEQWSFVGLQARPGWSMPTVLVGHGWEVSVIKIAGTDRSIGWSLRKVT